MNLSNWIAISCVILQVAQTRLYLKESENSGSNFNEENYRGLAYDLEEVLESHLKNWRFLTESSTTMDIGVVMDKRWFSQGRLGDAFGKNVDGNVPLSIRSMPPEPERDFEVGVSLSIENPIDGKNNTIQSNSEDTKSPTIQKPVTSTSTPNEINPNSKAITGNDFSEETRKPESQSAEHKRKKRSGSMPIMYMPGTKKKRQCVSTNGIFSGHNAFSYLSFITGVLSLILNVNNNINNNNNNNNLNANNAVSNNNVDANANSQTGNQIVVFPAGRKRRSLTDTMFSSHTRMTNADTTPYDGDDPRIVLSDSVFDCAVESLKLLSETSADGLQQSLKDAGDRTKGRSSSKYRMLDQMVSYGASTEHIVKAIRKLIPKWRNTRIYKIP